MKIKKVKQDDSFVNSINLQEHAVIGELCLKRDIKSKNDVGYLFKNICVKNRFLADSLWIYKSEISRHILEEFDKIEVGEKYNIKGIVNNIRRFSKEGIYTRFAFELVTSIESHHKEEVKNNKRKVIKKIRRKCPICGCLNVQKIHRGWYFCESCFNEFQF